jgi:AcrR family transcriptional regulator
VEALARTLGIAKSGFYWHFKDRDDLYDHMLDYWATEYTEIVAADPGLRKGTPEDRLYNLLRRVQDLDLGKYDIAMQSWAARDPKTAEVVHKVFDRRLRYVRGILSDMGFTGDDLEMRTRDIVCYQSAEYAMFGHESKRKRTRFLRLRLSLLTKKS